MLQPSELQPSKQSTKKAIGKIKQLMTECQQLKTDMNSLKNMTFKTKRKIDVEIKYVKDTLKNVLIKENKRKNKNYCDQADKENNSRLANKENCMNLGNKVNLLGQIQVKLQEKDNKNKDVKEIKIEGKRQLTLAEKIKLELQELKLIEYRENLISKKNQRINHYYSQHKTRIDGARSKTEASEQ